MDESRGLEIVSAHDFWGRNKVVNLLAADAHTWIKP